MIKDVVLFLLESILNAFSNSQELLWPPIPSIFQNYIPEDPKKLLSFVRFGSNMASAHRFEIHLIGSIGENICMSSNPRPGNYQRIYISLYDFAPFV